MYCTVLLIVCYTSDYVRWTTCGYYHQRVLFHYHYSTRSAISIFNHSFDRSPRAKMAKNDAHREGIINNGDNMNSSALYVAEFLSYFQALFLRAEEDVTVEEGGGGTSMAMSDTPTTAANKVDYVVLPNISSRRNKKRRTITKMDEKIGIPTFSGGCRFVTKSELLHKVKPVTLQMIQRILDKRKPINNNTKKKTKTSHVDSNVISNDSSSNTTKEEDVYISLLLDRLEVWGTKTLAQHEFSRLQPEDTTTTTTTTTGEEYSLVHRGKVTSNQLAYSASLTLLGLPDGQLLANYLPPCVENNNPQQTVAGTTTKDSSPTIRLADGNTTKTTNNPYTLPIPPNSLTWSEYLRLCYMLNQASSSDIVHEVIHHLSHSCPTSNAKSLVWFDQVAQEHHKWTRGEILATWVRAQRNTAAFRLLLHTFEFQQQEETTNLVALFRGNTKLTRTKVHIESNLVDMLAEFAIMNYYFVQRNSSSLATTTTTSTTTQHSNNRSNERSTDCTCTHETHKKVQRFLLQWFARRNRPYVSFLFSPSERSRFLIRDISPQEATEYLDTLNTSLRKNSSSNHCLAQIDQNISLGVFKSLEELKDSLDFMLSKSLELAPAKATTLREGLQGAIKDLHWLWDEFCYRNDLHHILCSDTNDSKESFVGLLSPPWTADRCLLCPQTTKLQETTGDCDLDRRVGLRCASCDVFVHSKCSLSFPMIKGASLHEYKPLERIFCARIPSSNCMDPKRKYQDLSWERKAVVISRIPSKSGQIPSWGMLIDHIEDCVAAFENITSMSWNPNDMNDCYAESVPLFLPSKLKGIIVKDFALDSAAKNAGIQIGDIITDVYMCVEGTRLRKFDLQIMKREDRENLFFNNYLELSLIIQRPSENIVSYAKEWRSLAESTVRALKGIVCSDVLPDYWCCPECTQETVNKADTRYKVAEEAMQCRLLIQRLSFDWCSIPFHEESTTGDSVMDKNCVSFRRLDLMMSEIIKQEQQINHDNGDAGALDYTIESDHPPSLIGPFHVLKAMQPGVSEYSVAEKLSDHKIRLEWAPDGLERRPKELLCRAMAEILQSPLEEDPFEQHRHEIALRFISLFQFLFMKPSYRFENGVTEEKKKLVKAYSFSPWTLNVCKVCGVRSIKKSMDARCSNDSLCGSFACQHFINPSCGFSSNEDEYWSSFIGSTFLALPQDFIIDTISRHLQVPIEHLGRPIEFVVMSYHGNDGGKSAGSCDQVFYVFPILYYKVIRNLLSIVDLTMDMIERLPGVIKVTTKEFVKLLQHSNTINTALDVAVHSICSSSTNDISRDLVSQDPGTENEFIGKKSTFAQNFFCSYYANLFPNDDKECHINQCFAADPCDQWKALIDSLSSSNIHTVIFFLEMCENARRHLFDDDFENDAIASDDDTCIDDGLSENRLLSPPRSKRLCLETREKEKDQFSSTECVCVYLDYEITEKDSSFNLHNPLLSHGRNDNEGSLIYVTLQRIGKEYAGAKNSSGDSYSGMGWGLQLLKWPNSDITVGRVLPNSPASSLLQTNDVILKINGRDAKEMESNGLLSAALLCLLEKKTIFDASNFLDGEASTKTLLDSISSPCCGPVVLEIYRFKAKLHENERGSFAPVETDIQSTQSECSEIPPCDPMQHSSKVSSYKDQSKGTHFVSTVTNRKIASQMTSLSDYPTASLLKNNYQGESQTTSHSSLPGQCSPSRNMSRFGEPKQTMHYSYVQRSDLYKQGFPGSILTRVETAVLLHSFRVQSPFLGLRLLTPRYMQHVVRQDYDAFISGPARENPFEIPLIPKGVWSSIIRADYKRSLSETGPIAFTEHDFSYRIPHQVLPLDRLLESILRNNEPEFPHQPPDPPIPPSNPPRPRVPCNSWTERTSFPRATSNFSNVPNNSSYENHVLHNQHRGAQQVTHFQPHQIANQRSTHPLTGQQNNQKMSSQFPIQPSNNGNDQSIQRIRGGGSTTETVLLSDLDHSTWNNQFVVGKCETKLGSTSTGFATFIGRVSEATDEPKIDVFYVSNIGFLNVILKKSALASQLHIATSAHERNIIQEALTRFFTDEMDRNPVNNITSEATIHVVEDLSSQPISVSSLSQKLFDRLLSRSNQTNPLGFLPDGSALYWMQSDQQALYFRNCEAQNHCTSEALRQSQFQKSQLDYKAILNRNYLEVDDVEVRLLCSGNFNCLWGCSAPLSEAQMIENDSQNLRQTLAFDNRDSHDVHVNKFHRFGCHDFQPCTAISNQDWFRIEGGSEIQRLCMHLTSAICARCMELLSYTTSLSKTNETMDEGDASACGSDIPQSVSLSPVASRIIFNERLLLAMVTRDSLLSFSSLPPSLDTSTKQLIRVWSRIFRLFAVEVNGAFRLSCGETSENAANCKALSSSACTSAEVVCDDDIAPASLTYSSCLCFHEPASKTSDRMRCQLCLGQNDCTIRTRGNEGGTDTSDDKDRVSGIGCLLLSSLYSDNCGMYPPPSLALSSKPCAKVPLDVLRSLLLQVASHIPPSLRKNFQQQNYKKSGFGCVRILNHSIWETEASYLSWTTFVSTSKNARMLAQAYTLMLHSVNNEKMPKWWKSAKVGWYRCVSIILQNPTVSSLALHLYVFDAALTDFLVSTNPVVSSKVAGDKTSGPETGTLTLKRKPMHANIEEIAIFVGEDIIRDSLAHLLEIPIQDRMKMIFEWGKELKLKSFNGEYSNECAKCDDGGDLLCCEFCNQVQHCSCCVPPLEEIPEFDWACDDCVYEINICYHYYLKENPMKKTEARYI